VGIGGILGFILVFLFQHKEAELLFHGLNDAIYLMPLPLIFLIFVLIAGLVGSSRLYLKAHQPMQVYGGFIIGIIAQFIALRFVP
jgi:hypothetical protein